MNVWRLCAFMLFCSIPVNCQSLLQFEHGLSNLSNNSYIYYANISDGDGALKCVTNHNNCSTDSDVGNWRDGRGRAVHQGADETTCLYVTRGHGEISLNRNSGCIPHTSGLWRCDVSASSEVIQSIYIYIANDNTSGVLTLSAVNFTLHTEPSVSPPEFTITCHTQGGPATTVKWTANAIDVLQNSDYESSQVIVDTSRNSVYENRLRVRGRHSGTYFCLIKSNQELMFTARKMEVKVAGEPTNLTAVISQSNSTHVNITVSWKSPDGPVTGYVIYYQSERGAVSSDMVSGGECHLLDGLQRGVTYNLSIVALSQHLPSILVGPVTVTSDTSRTKISSGMYSNVTRDNICISETNSKTENDITTATPTCFSVSKSVLSTIENDTDAIIYRCMATLLNDSIVATASITVTVMDNDFIPTSKSTTNDISPTSLTPSDSSLSSAHGSSDPNSDIKSTSHSGVTVTTVEASNSSIASTNMPNSTIYTNEPTHTYDPSSVTITADQKMPRDDYGDTRGDDGIIVIAIGSVIAIFLLIMILLFSCVMCLKCCMKDVNKRVSFSWRQSAEQELTVFTRRVEDDDIMSAEGRAHGMGDIAVSDFPDYVWRMMREDEDTSCMLANEYMDLQKVPRFPCSVACLSHNVKSNRFRNIYPYDDSRVCLPEIPGAKGSDYINASIITGYNGMKYIAAQGPMRGTVSHFWRMIWEYKVQVIIMLTRCVEMSRHKCVQYWPKSLSDSITPGDVLHVTLSSSLPYAEYEIRIFEVNSLLQPATNPLTVTQFHYTAWPDHGAPDNVMSIISFIRHVRKLFPVSLDQPLLVHCSAGVGRTGTFITLDTMMQQMKAEDTLSVYQCVRNLRTQRINMVQTLLQYEFIHHALSELVVCGETEVSASSLRSFTDGLRDQETGTGITSAQKHLQTLEYLSSQHKYDFTGANNLENVHKNRFPNKLPSELYRVQLSYNSKYDHGYINASFINGYKQRDAYIATQGPLENTVEDFWRMIWEYQCGCIVMLCQLVEDGQESSYCYWPGEEGEEIVCGKRRVRLKLVNTHGDTVTRKMEVTSVDYKSSSTNTISVTMIQLTSWPQHGLPHPTAITSLTDKVTPILMKCPSKMIVVMCSDGVVRSGTFICIHSQLERLKTESVVDVFQAIKSACIRRPGLIPNTDHYMFCYEVLAKYVENMDTYANFKAIM